MPVLWIAWLAVLAPDGLAVEQVLDDAVDLDAVDADVGIEVEVIRHGAAEPHVVAARFLMARLLMIRQPSSPPPKLGSELLEISGSRLVGIGRAPSMRSSITS